MSTPTEDAVTVRVHGPEQSLLTLLVEDELVVGREAEGLRIADPQVSRRHLRIRRVGTSVEVSDLGSTNGSYLEGLPLTGKAVVDSACVVVIGDTTVWIEPAVLAPAESTGRATMVRNDAELRSTSIDVVAGSVNPLEVVDSADSLAGDTMTIVFSDIESSTERATAMGDTAWFELLEQHNTIIRDELVRYGGREVKSIGDGFMLVFSSVRRALRFSTSVQRSVESDQGPDLRIRMGLHTGEAITDSGGDIFGRHVNLAARVANLAVGGQILASLVVREIASGREDATFGSPIRVELKGFKELQTVYEVGWADDPDAAT